MTTITETPVSILPLGTARPTYTHDPLPTWVTGLRELQVTAVREIMEAFNTGADVVFLDAPVGAGKTLIGELVRREMGVQNSVYICSDKALQDQFAADFDYAKVLKGRANYPTLRDMESITAEDCTSEGGDTPCMWCDVKPNCPYQMAKDEALHAKVAVLNTAYFLAIANHSRDFARNDFVVVDEADMLEGALIGFTEYEVPRWVDTALKLTYPKKGAHKATIAKWLDDTMEAGRKHYRAQADYMDAKQRRKWKQWLGATETVAGQIRRDAATVKDADDQDNAGRWIREYETRTFKLLPVMVDRYGAKNLWSHADKWLLMSGSIINAEEMADSLGVPGNWSVVTVPSPFPVENRPIIAAPVANMTYKATDDDYADVAYAIEQIVREHEGRVLVHTHSYKLTEKLVGLVNVPGRRKVTYTNGYGKNHALNEYLRTPGAVMFAPSMDRGVDLKGDKCEAMVIVKCPFPYMKDRRISARMRLPGGNTWYSTLTVRTIVQMVGRGVRAVDDVCPTYILDKQFVHNIWDRHEKLFPRYFRDAVNMRADFRWLVRAQRERYGRFQ